MKNEYIKLLGELVAFKSTVDRPEEKKAVIEYVKNWYEANGIEYKIYDHEKAPSIIATLPGTIDKKILLSSHLDVVPAADEHFTMTQEDTMLYGRGVSDDKGQAAIGMMMLKKMKEFEQRPTIQTVLTTDEEVGGFDGLCRLINEGHVNGDAAIVLDYGCDEHEIAVQEKGGMDIKLIAKGTAAHASRLWKGKNAIDILVQNIQKIQKHFDHTDQAPEYWGITCNLGIIKGGEAANQVPDYAEAVLDLRFAHPHTTQAIFDEIKSMLDENIEAELLLEIPYFESDPNDEFIKLYRESMSKSLNKEVVITKMYGATDARFFAGTDTAVWLASPLNGGHHTVKEWIDVNSTERFFNALATYLSEIK